CKNSVIMVNSGCFVALLGLGDPISGERGLEGALDEGRYPGKIQPPRKKSPDRPLMGSVEHGGRGPARLERAPGQPQSRKTLEIGLLEGQGRSAREIEPRGRPRD